MRNVKEIINTQIENREEYIIMHNELENVLNGKKEYTNEDFENLLDVVMVWECTNPDSTSLHFI